MILNQKQDWKEFLSTEDEDKLNELLKKIAKHKGAYKNAEETKMAQLWCTVLELSKENSMLHKRLLTLEDILEGMFDKVRKQERERLEMAKSLEKF